MAKDQTAASSSLQKFKQTLRDKNPGRLYVFYGEETFLLQHYLNQLRTGLLGEFAEYFNYHRLNMENFEMQSFADAVENLPMMSDRSLVQVDDVDVFKMNEADRTRFAEIISDIPDYCTVVLVYQTLEWHPDKRQKKLWEAVEHNAEMIEFGKQSMRDLVAWVTRHFAASGKRISNDLCVYLIDLTGGTMTELSSEISKICAFSGGEEIVKSDIDAVVEPVIDAVVFQMTDLLGQGKYAQALLKLQVLLKMQQEPLAILGAVGNHFRRISAARTLLDCGRPASELMKLCGMGDYPARKTMDAARRFSSEFCRKASELVVETDRKMKTSFDDPERLLELLLLQLAQEGMHG